MQTKRFTKNDEGFVCAACGFHVEPMRTSSRNHCPRCLCSLHVDVMPGDRANSCGGIMRPIGAMPDAKHGYIILHKCEKCGEIRKNRAALDCPQSDNLDLIIKLTACTH